MHAFRKRARGAARSPRGGAAGTLLAALALLPAAACGDAGPGASGRLTPEPSATGRSPAPRPTVVRLADVLAGTGPAQAAPAAPDVLLDGSDPSRWHSLLRTHRPATEEEQRLFDAASGVRADGAIEIGPYHGRWYATLPVRGGETLALRGTVEVRSASDGPEPVRVQAALAEFSEPLEGALPGELETLVDAFHTTRPVGAPSPRTPFALLVTLAPETRTVALVLSQSVADGSAPAGGARFEDVRLARPDVGAHWAHAASDPELAFARTHARGAFTLGRARRDGVALPAGGALIARVDLPDGPAHFETWLGLVPHPSLPVGRDVVIRAEWLRGAGGTGAVQTLEAELATQSVRASRWHRLTAPVPEELRGRAAVLRVTARAVGGGSPADPECLPALGAPRVVPEEPYRPGPNVVLVSLDTLRADHVGAYGYEHDTTPHLDRLAEESLVFEDVWAQGPYTLPSHMSLLSGQHPSVHAVQSDGDARDPLRSPLLAELLHAAGWSTAAFTGGGYVHPLFGFGGGFELFFSQDLVWNRESSRIRSLLEQIPDVGVALAEQATIDDVRDWLARHAAESFFLFFHTYAAHEFDPPAEHLRALGLDETGLSDDPRARSNLGLGPHEREDPLSAESEQRLIDLYDGAVRQADAAVGELVAMLRALELWDDTIVVVVSDHGQEIGERDLVGHGHTLYEEMLQVPLILRVPGAEPGRVGAPAMLVDVVPTLLALLGLPEAHEMQGHDLRDLPAERPLYAEVDHAAVKTALRTGALKTIHGPPVEGLLFPNAREEETYHLGRDPGEHAPLPPDPARVEAVERQRALLRDLSRRLASGRVAGGSVGADLRAQLEALGYGAKE